MNERREHPGIVGPIILIGAGALLLANRMGVAVDFVAILRMWPLLLIAVGVDLLIGRRSLYGALAAAVIVLAMFVGAFWLFGVTDVNNIATEDFSVELGDYETMELHLEPAVGRVVVDSMDDESKYALLATLSTVLGEGVDTSVSERAGNQYVSIRAEGMWTGSSINSWGSQPGWELLLNPALGYIVELDLGMGQIDLDLTGIELEELTVEMGLGQTILSLPEGEYRAVVDGAIGELVVNIPRGVPISIRTDTGIASRSMPSDFSRSGDRYVSPEYESGEGGIELVLGQAIGDLRVRYLP